MGDSADTLNKHNLISNRSGITLVDIPTELFQDLEEITRSRDDVDVKKLYKTAFVNKISIAFL